jgi:hypothetical protein
VFLEECLTEEAWSGQAMELLLSFDMYKGNSRCVLLGCAFPVSQKLHELLLSFDMHKGNSRCVLLFLTCTSNSRCVLLNFDVYKGNSHCVR